jgi:hypothetical protein
MQALLFIAMFSMFMSVAANIVVGSVGSTQQLTNQRKEEVENFFKSLNIVINNLTRNRFEATPASQNDPLAFIRTTQDLAQLSSGHWGDPTLDPWGNTITGLMAKGNRVLYSNGTDSVVAPVTAFAFISPGSNRELETEIPSTPSIAALQGILPPVGSDDIVSVFTNEPAQRENWAVVQHRLDRIAAAEMRYYQIQAFEYRVQLMDQYLEQIKINGLLTPPDISQMMRDDPNAPQFLDLNSDENRRLLGVDDDFAVIERTLSSGGRLLVRTTTNADKSITLQVTNDPNYPTPWNSALSYTQTLKGNL